jgi:hypothetical protein
VCINQCKSLWIKASAKCPNCNCNINIKTRFERAKPLHFGNPGDFQLKSLTDFLSLNIIKVGHSLPGLPCYRPAREACVSLRTLFSVPPALGTERGSIALEGNGNTNKNGLMDQIVICFTAIK